MTKPLNQCAVRLIPEDVARLLVDKQPDNDQSNNWGDQEREKFKKAFEFYLTAPIPELWEQPSK